MKGISYLMFCIALTLSAKDFIEIKPDRSFILDESKYILPQHFRMYADPYNENVFFQVPSGYVIFDKKGELLKKCLYDSPQEPGGLTTALQISFFKDYYYVADHFHANKYGYNYKFIKKLHPGAGIGMASSFCEDGSVCLYGHVDGLKKINAEGETVIKRKEYVFKSKTKNSMVNFFVLPVIYYDNCENVYYLAFQYEYKLYKINKETLETINTFGDVANNYKKADDSNPNVYRVMGMEEFKNLLKGYSSIESIFTYKNNLFVYWCNRFTADSFIDIYNKKTQTKIKSLQLAPLKGKGGLVTAYDDINLRFYQEDIVPSENGEDEATVIREYDLKRYIDE